ncbi:MAG: MarR family winged helix-turn-helix transcriptional regulator [Pseudoclavibacter sp.]
MGDEQKDHEDRQDQQDPVARLIEQIGGDRAELASLLIENKLQRFLELDLTVQQVKIVLLVASGEAETGKDLAFALGVKPSTISASVEKLVQHGYLERVESPDDRRVKHLIAAEPGLALNTELLDRRDDSESVLSRLAVDDLAALARGTRALLEACRQQSD